MTFKEYLETLNPNTLLHHVGDLQGDWNGKLTAWEILDTFPEEYLNAEVKITTYYDHDEILMDYMGVWQPEYEILNKENKVYRILVDYCCTDTDWNVLGDYLVRWLVDHPNSTAFDDFVYWIEDEYFIPDEYGSIRFWDFFTGINSVDEFIELWFDNPEEAVDFKKFLEEKGYNI